jgi:hypothetical protein
MIKITGILDERVATATASHLALNGMIVECYRDKDNTFVIKADYEPMPDADVDDMIHSITIGSSEQH